MVCRRLPVDAGLEEVGAHRGADQVQELAQDAVLIEARYGGKRALDALPDAAPRRPAARLMSSLRAGSKRR